VGTHLSASKNKGGLALLIFEHQVVYLLHASHHDLDANEFQTSSRRIPLFGAWHH
jgi:hypothetical protein